jgi:RNA polymerase sigma-70 factor (ECF subfamily)
VTTAHHQLGPTAVRLSLDPESRLWLEQLRFVGAQRDSAIERLHERLLRIARAETRRRSGQLRVSGVELDDLAHQAAADALVAILGKLDQFRGESRFTTWAHRFVVFEVSSKIARHFWQTASTPMAAEDWERLPAAFGLEPAQQSEWRELLAGVRAAVDEVLSPRQRRVFVALVLAGTPLDALVLELGSNPNAVYKTMFDARRKVRAALVANGHLSGTDQAA